MRSAAGTSAPVSSAAATATGRSTRDAAASRLRAIADRLAGRELLVAVEAFPWSAIPDVDCAVDLLRRAGAPNAGLMIDVWHFYNGGASSRCWTTCRARGWPPCS